MTELLARGVFEAVFQALVCSFVEIDDPGLEVHEVVQEKPEAESTNVSAISPGSSVPKSFSRGALHSAVVVPEYSGSCIEWSIVCAEADNTTAIKSFPCKCVFNYHSNRLPSTIE